GLIVGLGLIVWAIVPVIVEQITRFVQDIPGIIEGFRESELYLTLEAQFGEQFQGLVEAIQSFLSDMGNLAAIGGGALQVGMSIASGVSGTVIVIVLVIYFVATLPAIKQSLLRLVP